MVTGFFFQLVNVIGHLPEVCSLLGKTLQVNSLERDRYQIGICYNRAGNSLGKFFPQVNQGQDEKSIEVLSPLIRAGFLPVNASNGFSVFQIRGKERTSPLVPRVPHDYVPSSTSDFHTPMQYNTQSVTVPIVGRSPS